MPKNSGCRVTSKRMVACAWECCAPAALRTDSGPAASGSIHCMAPVTCWICCAAMNPNAGLITGVICGHRVEEIEDPLMQQIRYMDKLVDEVARGKKMSAILRGSNASTA